MKADNGIQQPPVCPLCHERCGRFLCPCCGGHAPFPWKCEACTPHSAPCMSHLGRSPRDTWIGCLILVGSVLLMALVILWIIRAVTS